MFMPWATQVSVKRIGTIFLKLWMKWAAGLHTSLSIMTSVGSFLHVTALVPTCRRCQSSTVKKMKTACTRLVKMQLFRSWSLYENGCS